MIQKNEQLFEDALNLAPSDRSRLAARLIQSLDDAEPLDAAQWEAEWNAACDHRNAELDSGQVAPISSAEAYDRLARGANVSRDD
jgi:hypothetical protein